MCHRGFSSSLSSRLDPIPSVQRVTEKEGQASACVLDITLCWGFALMLPACVWEGAPTLRGSCCIDAAALRLFLLQQLLSFGVIQWARAGLDRDGVSLHADVISKDTSPWAPYLLQVIPFRLITGQEAYSFHNLDLFLRVAVVRANLQTETIARDTQSQKSRRKLEQEGTEWEVPITGLNALVTHLKGAEWPQSATSCSKAEPSTGLKPSHLCWCYPD